MYILVIVLFIHGPMKNDFLIFNDFYKVIDINRYMVDGLPC